jgi:hypothetical protein
MRSGIVAIGIAACLLSSYGTGAGLMQMKAPNAETEPLATTLCAVMRNPAAYANRMVKLRASPEFAFEHSSIIDPADRSCEGPWFKTAPESDDVAAILDTWNASEDGGHPLRLIRDANYDSYEQALRAKVYPMSQEAHTFWNMGGHPRYRVTATMNGRVEYAGKFGRGFGHMTQSRVQFTLTSVENVTTEELPYDWTRFSRTPGPFPHGIIHGKVTDAKGLPIASVQVEAIRSQGKANPEEPSTSTDRDGNYSIELQSGSYYLIVQRKTAATKQVPLQATYHPSTEERDRAAVVTVSGGAELDHIDIQASHA